MSDIASVGRLKPSSAQLPVSWYLDPEVFALEKKLLFDAGPNYAGHALMVPNPGDFRTLEWMDHAKVLVRNAAAGDGSVRLLSNVCRHRQAIMLEGRGNTENIVCPLHRWTYDLEGELLGAPHFRENPCVRLNSAPLTNWQGLLFTGPRDPHADLAGLSLAADFDFSGYVLDRVLIDDYPINWKTFIEVYLEVYHVDPFHPGLSNFTDCENFRLESGAHYSLQIVGPKDRLGRPGTPVYKRWHEACLAYLGERKPKYGALWLTYFPGLTLEWYPDVLVVSRVVPRSPTLTTNIVEFYYPEDIALFEREFVEAQQAAYIETAIEDGEICTRMDRGRTALHAQGSNETGPYQSPMEDALVHFHEYLRRELKLPA
ncbi:MAG: aromatic ring-hydroxylating dioxygenase subunit alpha [Betaproteobacteria bacterium]|nr:aromatic ring-hydroxylating dioxygenase subunit alpha [Betaproteobacteria bacterium]